MTALTRLIDAYRLYLSRGVDDHDAMVLALDDAEIDGDNFWNMARNCFPQVVVSTEVIHYDSYREFVEH